MNRLVARLFTLLLLAGIAIATSQAAEEMVTFDDPAQGKMYYSLLEEYRCLKCQNQNLAGSKASLAGDLRREIRDQVLAGKTKKDIDEYLVARYGEFVLYRPRFSAKTAVLWIAPFVLLLVAIGSLVLMIKRRNGPSARHNGTDAESAGDLDTVPQRLPLSADEKNRLEKARRLLD